MITPSAFPKTAGSDEAIIARSRELSPFFHRTLEADALLLPALQSGLHQVFDAEQMRATLAEGAGDDEDALKRKLRRLRKQVMLHLIARDLNGLADLAEVVETCTVLAEVTVISALKHLSHWQRQLYGDPVGESGTVQQLLIAGMGKLGGRELNVSSDIDLIFAYEEDGETNGARQISNHEYFARLGKKLIAAIGETTADGFVFRVDMRLRPYGDSGPLVGSFAALEEYYQTQGREWERYAWIKGRVIAGPEQALQDLLRPFVFRKYLDYGAFASMRDLKAQIMREVARRDMHDNIKLGPGGIREIEFIAQVFQLIRGGQDRELQIRPTLQVLQLLEKKSLLPPETVAELSAAYVFLRNLEHRLQYLQDAQTQMLPADDENRARIAAGMGFADWAGFLQELGRHRASVERHFSQVFDEPEGEQTHSLAGLWEGSSSEEGLQQQLAALGYRNTAEAWQRLNGLRSASRYKQLPAASRQRFDALVPRALEASARHSNADETLARMLTLLEAICRRASYLALLAEYPQALDAVARLCSASPWLAAYLTQHPILLDELLDTRSLYAAPDFSALRDDLESRLADCGEDVERKLDVLRHFKHAQTFRFAAQDLTGELPLETLSDDLSALADLVLDAVIRHAWPGLRNRHREAPAFSIIGYGKLGSKELGYASDLDIVFLYDDVADNAGEVYARFGQRINNWLNSLTPAGLLYETDLRLRPDGASGLLVSSVEAFTEYQKNKAWTWEHQALTRARFCAGAPAIGNAFEQVRLDILRQPRDLAKLREEVVAMRQKIHDGHPNNTPLFDIKHDAGGIVDVEFIVQTLVLAYARQYPQLAENVGNLALLGRAGEVGLILPDLARSAADAYRDYRNAQHVQRLQGAEKSRVDREPFVRAIAAVKTLWDQVLGDGLSK
ncbi:MAG TPA: bifunctional [glutamate--ammonia ligase]-adenylyl-L-tyrosine phosphorylase/[glutamate--ammonia-ligase] adenylyltransferase [Methylophilaceae bacterium]|nr:bifunctional [glutamate--ammonia ligase]-adenylyl-L-tyrosine phosphorylase/[glutamate--ammonia-ligase] adenylyltransferase [Methylophilaceae bacterium]